jgi:hypothetical protein
MGAVQETRQYEPVWAILKRPPHTIVLEVHPALVRRVQKAVSKEKYNDLAFKELHGHKDEDYFQLKFNYVLNTQQLTIVLVNRFGVDFPGED